MRLFFSVFGICVILVWAISTVQDNLAKLELQKKSETVRAEIIKLSCGKRDNIKFAINGKTWNERIYLDDKECAQLKTQRYIALKMDESGLFVYANPSYNDRGEFEIVSTILLSAFLIFAIYWYQLRPALLKSEE